MSPARPLHDAATGGIEKPQQEEEEVLPAPPPPITPPGAELEPLEGLAELEHIPEVAHEVIDWPHPYLVEFELYSEIL